jgi:cell wall assembly regulator SMI1
MTALSKPRRLGLPTPVHDGALHGRVHAPRHRVPFLSSRLAVSFKEQQNPRPTFPGHTLARSAPVSTRHIGPPARRSDIATVEALLRQPLPEDLLAWWRHSCGTTDPHQLRLIPPNFTPYTVDEAVDFRELMLEIAESMPVDEAAEHEPAGSPTITWLPMWLPLAGDGGGNYLFCDLRPGSLHGCVMTWDHGQAAELPPIWPSVAAMLGGIAEALEHRAEIRDHRPQAREDGVIDWV